MLNNPSSNDSDTSIQVEDTCCRPLFAPTFERTRVFELSDSQEGIIKSYVETYAEQHFTNFITAAPLALRPLRLFIINQSLTLNSKNFELFLDKFYPTVARSDATYKQNEQLRGYLLSFNQMVMGNFDVNHELFNLIFTNKLTTALPDSPTKRNLVRDILRREVSTKFNLTNNADDKFVEAAKRFIDELISANFGIKPKRLFL